jgi:hypothetical protein
MSTAGLSGPEVRIAEVSFRIRSVGVHEVLASTQERTLVYFQCVFDDGVDFDLLDQATHRRVGLLDVDDVLDVFDALFEGA